MHRLISLTILSLFIGFISQAQELEEWMVNIEEIYSNILDKEKVEDLALDLFKNLENDDSEFKSMKYQLLAPIFYSILQDTKMGDKCTALAGVDTSEENEAYPGASLMNEWNNIYYPKLFTNEDPDNAKNALEFIEKNPSLQDFNTFNYVAYAYENNGDFSKAGELYERALTFVKDDTKEFYSYSFYTNFLSRSGEYLRAENFIKKIEDLANRTNSYLKTSYQAESMTTKTAYYSYIGDYSAYIDVAKKQYEYFETLADPSDGCNVNQMTLSTISAHSYELLGDHVQAKKMWLQRDQLYDNWITCQNEKFPQMEMLPLSMYPMYRSKRGELKDLNGELEAYIEEVVTYYKSFEQYATMNVRHSLANHLGFLFAKEYHDRYENLLNEIKNRRDFTEATLPFSYYAYFCMRDLLYDNAFVTYDEMFGLNEQWIDDLISTFGEKAFVTYFNIKIKQGYDNYHSYVKILHDLEHPLFKKAISQDYNNLLLTKSIGFKGTLKKKNLFLKSNNQEVKDLYNEWVTKKRDLINFYQQVAVKENVQPDEAEKSKQQLALLQEEVDRLENELAVKAENFKKYLKIEKPNWKSIRNKLKEDEVAIEMIRFDWRDQVFYSDSAYYAAYIIRKNSNSPEVVYLPTLASKLDDRSYKGYKNFIRLKQEDRRSYELFWKPIKDKLEGINKVYFAPDGIYHLINLPTLLNPETGNFLLEEMQVQYVTSTANLQNTSVLSNKRTVLFGRPQYNLAKVPEDENPSDTRSFVRNFSEGNIADLPGSEEEVRNISDVLKGANVPVEFYLGEDATEGQMYKIENPGILHIATHGYWAQVKDANPGYRMFNAMVNSGLLLAGVVNYYSEPEYAYTHDGVLTAYEAQSLKLETTGMVILSACETGLGDFDAGEGVYGLQRAFRAAGAKSVMTSLWKVDDAATKDFMIHFYETLLSSEDKFQAFRAAQLYIKEKYTDPYYWGAFVLSGI
jgi:CHAT domain-containing protein